MSRIKFIHTYNDIISVENLLEAWQEFMKGKKRRKDVRHFQMRLMDNIIQLHLDLKNKIYIHRTYEAFTISDPKFRNIHKASVRDRILHRAIYRKLYPFFEKKFTSDSFSCRLNKGTHKALDRFTHFFHKVSRNNRRTCWVLKCDIKKFFASIDQPLLLAIVEKHIGDPEIVSLISEIVGSFHSTRVGKGLPLGNLTSQLLVNVYMNEFDQFVKHTLKVKYYIRYADDFVLMHHDRAVLVDLQAHIDDFLVKKLQLALHPDKVFIKTFSSGVDFLGWVHFPTHRVLRTTTKRRMFKNIRMKAGTAETVQSYLGLLRHGNTYGLQEKMRQL